MVRKTAVAGAILVTVFGIALVDKYCVPLAVGLCGVLIYVSFKNLLNTWVGRILGKSERIPYRYSRGHHRRRSVRLRSTYSSGVLLPWIEKLVILVTKLNQRSQNQSSPSEEEFDQDDLSLSSDQSSVFTADIQFCGRCATETSEIKTFVHHISQSYVQSWYSKISSHEEFVQDLDYILEDVLVNLCGRLSKLNLNQVFNQIFILSQNHLLKYYENSVEDRNLKDIHSRIKGSRKAEQLHPALKDPKSELGYLTTVCGTLVDLIGPQDLLLCPLLRTVLTEILTHNLLLPTVKLVSDPAFIFWTIVFFFGDANSLTRVSRTKVPKLLLHPEHLTTPSKRNLDLSLPLKNKLRKRLKVDSTDTASRRNRLTRTKSLSYNSLTEMDERDYELRSNEGEMTTFPHHMTRDNNFRYATDDSSMPMYMWNSGLEHIYYVTRPPFSLFPVPGHSRRAEKELSGSRKSSPTRIFPGLPKKKGFSLPRSSSLHSSLSLDELLLPATKVFQPNGTHTHPSREPSPTPAPTFSLDVEQAEEATEADDVQQFYNIRIVGTDELYDSARKKYILYCIQYDYLEPSISESKDGEGKEAPSLVPCTAVVRRRFREFLALQSRLEKSKLKKHLNGIKGPSKWLSSPFPATDKRNVEKRRLFLQEYLQKLCLKEALANSPELHEFLAYKGDARIAFVKKAPELPVPRLDKMVVKGVMGALDLLKTALPSMPQESPGNGESSKSGIHTEKMHSSTRSILTGFTRNKSEARLPSLEFNCRVERSSALSQEIYNFLDSFDTSSSPENSGHTSPILYQRDGGPSWGLLTTSAPAWRRAASRLDSLQSPTGPRSQGDGCDSVDLEGGEANLKASQLEKTQESFQAEIPLANALVDMFLTVLFPTHSLSDDYSVLTFKVLLGDLLQKWLQKELCQLGSRRNCIHYMHNLHEILWPPTGQPGRKIRELEVCREVALQTLLTFFPGKLTLLLGITDVSFSLSSFLDCLQNNQTNKNLLYQIIDVVTDMMCAQDLQQSALI